MGTAKLSEDALQTRVFRSWFARIGCAGAPHLLPEILPIEPSKTPVAFARDGTRGFDDAFLVDDPSVSTRHAQLIFRDDHFELVDLSSTNGTFINSRRLQPNVREPLKDGDLIQMGATFLRFRTGMFDEIALPRTPTENDRMTSISPEFLKAVTALRMAARSGAPALILGETGSGKEIFARTLHELSGRIGPFVAINMAGIQPTLMQAELFGVERGAHSTAEEKRLGLIRTAEGGTVFLDEIGDMHFESQAALLRLLQEGEVPPVGADFKVRVDVRFVAATHRDPDDGEVLRPDLIARLRGKTIEIPPLRARIEDMGLLIARILGEVGAELRFTPSAYAHLCSFHWPENVRQLHHALVDARTVARNGEVTVEMLHDFGLRKLRTEVDEDEWPQSPEEIETALRERNGHVGRTAEAFGRTRMSMTRYLKKLGIDPNDYRQRPRKRQQRW